MKKITPEVESGGLSVVGPVREDNQDSIYVSSDEHPFGPGLLFAIADGMGGYANGGLASITALESFSSTLALQKNTAIPKALQRGIEAANLQVYKKAQQLDAGRMGTTLTVAYVFGEMLYLAHVGDSRAYLIRDGHSSCLTVDHTAVGDMVRAKIISSDKVRTHAHRSVLTKSIGTALFVQPDITQVKLKEDDYLILCSDGVWSVIEDDEFARAAHGTPSIDEISHRLIDLAIHHETDDNASVVVFHIRKFMPASFEHEIKDKKSAGWFNSLRKFVS